MLNHIYLIVFSEDDIGFIREFKKNTSKEMKRDIRAYEPNILPLFENKDAYSFWMKTNMPILIVRERFYYQKKLCI